MRLGAIERKILAGFLLALVISLIVGFVLYRNAARNISTERWVRHTDEVIEQLDKLVESLVDLDAGQRGYLLTTNEIFLNRVDRRCRARNPGAVGKTAATDRRQSGPTAADPLTAYCAEDQAGIYESSDRSATDQRG